MRAGSRIVATGGSAVATVAVLWLGVGLQASRGDDQPRGLGRLFRFGSATKPAPAPTPGPADRPKAPANGPAPTSGSAFPPPPTSPFSNRSYNPAAAASLPADVGAPALMTQPGPANAPRTQPPGDSNAQRIVPQPRVNRATTEADPLVTRVALGRADDGKQFGMFLQVFADGTVIDSEGTHKVGADLLRPVVQAMQAVEAARVAGHCGGPPTDFIETVHVVLYDRAFGGRLRANALSYSGNNQGCDPSIRQLQEAIEAIQVKISPAPSAAPPTAAPTSSPAASPVASNAAALLPADAPLPAAAPPLTLTPP